MSPRTREFKDYYKILGIPETAGPPEIKKAYRKLALEYHPDHHPGDVQSEDQFKEISEAYGVLIDPSKRREYDLFRGAHLSGRAAGAHQFRYSQQDIFEGMFREGSAREIFEELNREFNRSGFRSGNSFFETMFFGGAIGGLSRILGMIPGPLGKIGYGLRIAHMVGSSILAYNRMRQAGENPPAEEGKTDKKSPPLVESIKGIFHKSAPSSETLQRFNLGLAIAIPPAEALTGTRKKISYKVGNETENLVVRIPPNFPPGGKLRIKEKGYRKNGKRGDLILTIKIEAPQKT
ncbi:MAG: DnaJ domain-containing protein [Nitrospinaceae bacterium]